MKNYLQSGDVLDFTAPAGGVIAGVGAAIGVAVVIPETTAAQGEVFSGRATGVFELASQTDAAWAEGDLLYFATATKTFTKVAAGGVKAGYAVKAKALADATGWVRLTPTI